MSEAVVVLAKKPSRFSFPTLVRPALAAMAVLVLVLAGATSAAASSIPGDALYGVKRATEDVRLALTFDPLARTQLLSEMTDRRLEELAEIAKRRPSSAPAATQEYADAVERFENALDDLHDAVSEDKRAAAQALPRPPRENKAVLDAVKDRLSEEDQTDVQKVIDREEEHTSPSNPGSGQGGSVGGRPSSAPAKPTPRK